MYTTIEPRLITLLNDASSEPFSAYPRLDYLPPLDHSILKTSGRPLPLEPNASIRSGHCSSTFKHQTIPLDREFGESITATIGDVKEALQSNLVSDRALGGTSPQSLRKILDDTPHVSQSQTSKRRQRPEAGKDEFVQLPQPPKKQKTTQQVIPPVIIGLYDPPANAALFPPIASSSFHDSHGRNSLNIAPHGGAKNHVLFGFSPVEIERPDTETSAGQKPITKSRKKWTEAETTQLLLGVQKHGVGNWTKILQDQAFHFDGRKAVDLKDRFRTCCPTEFREQAYKEGMTSGDNGGEVKIAEQPNLRPGNTQIQSDSLVIDEKTTSVPDTNFQKSRAHRKKLEDLAMLGINEPFKRSRRRERHPFSEKEDLYILQGFREYGTAWTKILNDPKFDLKSRRPTDLRDRLRNRFPEIYNEGEAQKAANEVSNSTSSLANLLPPSPTAVTSSVYQEPSVPQRWKPQPSTSTVTFIDLLGPTQGTDAPGSLFPDWTDGLPPFSNSMGDMDISRMLLDEP
jgi:hypothetical protein